MSVDRIKIFLLRRSLQSLIDNYGIEKINDQLSDIFFHEADERDDYFYDDLSEKYDEINKFIRYSKK